MKNPIQAMFEAGIVEATDFPPESRYNGVPTTTIETADGRLVTYLSRRFIPSAEAFATQGYRIVAEGERLDLIAASVIGDPLAFWRLCDSNQVIWPETLETAGRELRLTLPQGVAGPEEEA